MNKCINRKDVFFIVYIFLKIIATFFSSTMTFGVFTLPFSIALGLNDGIYGHIALILTGLSVTWIVTFVMSFFSKPVIKSIAVYSAVALSFIDVLCLIKSIVSNVSEGAVSNLSKIIIIKALAILINVLAVFLLIKYIRSYQKGLESTTNPHIENPL